MKCRKAQKLLSARFDGQPDTSRSADLAEHLAGCESCRQFSDRLLSSGEALELLTVSEPSADFTDRVLARLPEAEPRTTGVTSWIHAIRPARAAAALVGLCSGAVLALSMNGDTPPQADDRQNPADAVLVQSFESIPEDSAEARYLALLQEGGK